MSEIPEILISFPGGKKVNAEAFGHIIETDQSRRAGGDGSAPEPFALFLASIGTCAGIYVLSFLQSRGLSTEGLQIRQRLHFNPTTGLLASVDLDIEVPDSVPEKYHTAIRRAADMCTVKKVIESQPSFSVKVSSAAATVAA
jgi:ribosomal protein S12 methylthiotransferase accessory factor